MEKARIFINGGSQAVRLPKNFRFEEDEVFVNKIGNAVILLPKNDPWASMKIGLSLFTEDFMEDYKDLPVEEKDAL